jgi:regulator of sirC expression with transglutaminase-like and TPR domain
VNSHDLRRLLRSPWRVLRRGRSSRHFTTVLVALVGVASTIIVACCVHTRARDSDTGGRNGTVSAEPTFSRSLASWLAEPSAEAIANTDIAEMNLLCAADLPGADGLDIRRCLRDIESWSNHVRAETDRYFHKYRERPEQFSHSEADYRMAMLATVLQQDFGVTYNVDRIEHMSFANSQDLFLHGILTRKVGGTCVSLPVLYVAIGRRLGYPLKLARCKGHLFCRWDGRHERFNIECTGVGYKRRDDFHFMRWPYPISDAEVRAGLYLTSLSPSEELAMFLATRGHCLFDNGKLSDAIVCFSRAHRLHPQCLDYLSFISETKSRALRELLTSQTELGNSGLTASGARSLLRGASEAR